MPIYHMALRSAIGLVLTVACSKGESHPAAGSPPSNPSAAQAPSGNACDRKLVTAADAADILGAPITETKALEGDAQSCVFTTAKFATLTVTLRPGVGGNTVRTWLSGKMPVSATPLSGVGEQAAWVPELHEVVATKHDLLCDILPMGAADKGALQKKDGDLCNKIFAAS